MAMTVTVAGTDRTSAIDWRSFRVEQVLTSQSDTCEFTVMKYGGTGFIPAVNDTVLVDDGGTDIFGGLIVRVTNEAPSVGITKYTVQAVSYERYLDRFLSTEIYKNESAFFVINSLMNEFVNQDKYALATMETGETWTNEAGTPAFDTTNYIYGSRGRKFSPSASGTETSRTEHSPTLDLTKFDNNKTSTTSDQITLWAYIDKPTNLASIRLRLVNETGGTYTNYYEQSWTTGFRTGWQQFVVAKSAMTANGSPVWTDIETVQLQAVAKASGAVNVTFDDVRMIAELGVTQKGVKDATVILKSVKFNYEQVSECIRQIAKVLGYEWYVSPTRDLQFFPPSTTAAPGVLDDTSGNFVWKSLQVRDDLTNLKNQIFVRGGEELGVNQTEDLSHQADGTNKVFKMGYKYSNLVLEVNSVGKTVGVDFIDDPTSFDALYNFNEKTIRFQTAPLGTDTVEVTGDPHVPIIIKKRDSVSIDTYGEFEYRIVDKTITTREGARQRATAELTVYRDTITDGSFRSYLSGWQAGQEVTINSTIRSISDSYIINRLVVRMKGPSDAEYHCSIVNTRTFGMIDFLIGLLRQEAKAIEIGQDEVLDLVESYEETVTVSEVVSVVASVDFPETVTAGEADYAAIDTPPTWVWGSYSPTAILPTDPKRPVFADRDNIIAS